MLETKFIGHSSSLRPSQGSSCHKLPCLPGYPTTHTHPRTPKAPSTVPGPSLYVTLKPNISCATLSRVILLADGGFSTSFQQSCTPK